MCDSFYFSILMVIALEYAVVGLRPVNRVSPSADYTK
jgi:hypothetical protein